MIHTTHLVSESLPKNARALRPQVSRISVRCSEQGSRDDVAVFVLGQNSEELARGEQGGKQEHSYTTRGGGGKGRKERGREVWNCCDSYNTTQCNQHVISVYSFDPETSKPTRDNKRAWQKNSSIFFPRLANLGVYFPSSNLFHVRTAFSRLLDLLLFCFVRLSYVISLLCFSPFCLPSPFLDFPSASASIKCPRITFRCRRECLRRWRSSRAGRHAALGV